MTEPNEVSVSRDEQQAELITSKHALAAFEFLVWKPVYSSLLLLNLFILTYGVSSLYWAELRADPVHLEPYNTRLKNVVEALRDDFGGAREELQDAILISGDNALDNSAAFGKMEKDITSELQNLMKTRESCKTLEWEKAHFGKDSKFAVVQLTLKAKNAYGQRNPCLFRVRKMLKSINGQDGLKAVLAGPHSVIDASYEQCDKETMWHLMFSAPLLALLLMLGVGTLPRVVTPFLCLLASVHGGRASIILLKWQWNDLNLVGPDTQVIFVLLALCIDYSLFYWVRLSQELRKNPDVAMQALLLRTLRTSGFVIALSTVILIFAFIGASCYPDLNKMGYLGATLNLAFGVLFVGFYSMTIPTVLASMFPSTFEEPHHDSPIRCISVVWSALRAPSKSFSILASVVTSKPWVYILPLVVLSLLSPLAFQVWHLDANYDISRTDFSATVPEFGAHESFKTEFENLVAKQMTVMMSAESKNGLAHLLGHSAGDALSQVLRAPTCELVQNMSQGTLNKKYGVGPHDISCAWWDPQKGACSSQMLDVGGYRYISEDKLKHRLMFHPHIDSLVGLEAQGLIRYFWEHLEPKASVKDGTGATLLAVQVYTPIAEEMLLEMQYRYAAPWILGITVLSVCCFVAYVFSSYFVGIKMVFTVALPILAEYGFAVGVYQYGWLDWAGFPSTGGLKWTMLYTTTGFLFALAMDYDLFLFARVYERRLQGFDNESAVRLAVQETGPLITLAGTLMVVAFAFVFLSSVPVIAQIGCLYCFGVAMDVYVVRVWLAPTALCLYPPMNYWPRKMPAATKSHADWEDDLACPESALRDDDEKHVYKAC
eukprot:TRINITY_DN27201_c0_g1_i1.p1 TRINITY_DN27201_c0_g1~~TRINITY_DN27201_c0_g1_i1.p1  ORF type:complete len:829 (+),score=138.85 TRINITY_DN27201_c0_g1_i1:64-2550(+)